MLDFNRSLTKTKQANDGINVVIDAHLARFNDEKREYLGASALGHDCLRKVQWDWQLDSVFEPQTKRIFQRGHWWERYGRNIMCDAGFKIGQSQIEFSQLDGKFKGHGDGVVTGGPAIDGVSYPCLWETKCLGQKGWDKLAKDGLKKTYQNYYVQVQIYMAYIGLTENPTIFTACNGNTMELLHLLVPFDPETAQSWSDKAILILDAAKAGEVLPRVTDNSDDFRCRFCGHKEKCWSVKTGGAMA